MLCCLHSLITSHSLQIFSASRSLCFSPSLGKNIEVSVPVQAACCFQFTVRLLRLPGLVCLGYFQMTPGCDTGRVLHIARMG